MKSRKLLIGFLSAIIFTMSFVTIPNSQAAQPFSLTAQNWQLSADGQWLTIVKAENFSQRVHFRVSIGEIIPIPEWVYANGNVIKVVTPGQAPLTIFGRQGPQVRALTLPAPADVYKEPLQVTVMPVGPHLVSVGFSWLDVNHAIQQYQILRSENGESDRVIAYVNGNTTTYKDDGVLPNTAYKYKIVALGSNSQPMKSVTLGVKTPPAMVKKNLDALSGKGVILYIDPTDPRSSFYYKVLTPLEVVADCKRLGFRYIELRTVYGAYSHFLSKDVMNWLTQLLDLAAESNIYVIAWSVPRHASIESIAKDIAVAGYVTPSGHTFAGCALDLETGSDYMGNLPQAKDTMSKFATLFRKAVGPNYLVSAIVFTPWQTGYSNTNYPYKELAQNVDVLQPMEFWHHYFASSGHVYNQQEVAAAILNSVSLTQQLAGKDIPVNVIAQSINLGNTGMPSSLEIAAALQAAKSAMAIGVSFFAWNPQLIKGTSTFSEQAQAMQNFLW